MTQAAALANDAYIPGVCNINTAEIARRRKVGYVGLVIFAALLVVFLALGLNRWLRLILILPAMLSANGFLQAKNHFCVGYGGHGLQNATEGSDAAVKVDDQEAIAKDRKRASQMNRQSMVIGLVIGLLTLLIPATI